MSIGTDGNWLRAIKKLGSFAEADVLCPSCRKANLRRIDVSLREDNEEFERIIYCCCGELRSLRMSGAKNFMGAFNRPLSASELLIVQNAISESEVLEKLFRTERARRASDS